MDETAEPALQATAGRRPGEDVRLLHRQGWRRSGGGAQSPASTSAFGA